MSGQSARAGFEFQDLYLLQRVLRTASEALEDAWRLGTADVIKAFDGVPVRFGIEAAMPVDAQTPGSETTAADWDVLVDTGAKFEFAEVKSGVVEKTHRIAFWCRLRRELGRDMHQAKRLVPILVVDPSKTGDVSKWQQIASVAAPSTSLSDWVNMLGIEASQSSAMANVPGSQSWLAVSSPSPATFRCSQMRTAELGFFAALLSV